jgi:hypothetical protein
MSIKTPDNSPTPPSDPILKKSNTLFSGAVTKALAVHKNELNLISQPENEREPYPCKLVCDSFDVKDTPTIGLLDDETKGNLGVRLRPSKKGSRYDWPTVLTPATDNQTDKVKEKEDEEEEEMEMEFDSYVYLGIVLPDFILFAYDIIRATLGQGELNLSEKKLHNFFSISGFLASRLCKLLLFGVLLIPGLMVPFIQMVVIGSFEKGNLDLNLFENEKTLLSFAKIFMMFMFGCMALKELSNASKNWMYTLIYMKRLAKV